MAANPDAHSRLVGQLQRAYSGELAAAYAYRGHWRALPSGEDRVRIRKIEEEEWHHRRTVGDLLRGLGARPRWALEARAWVIGRTLGLLCHVAGWFLPMYGAGKLERRNVGEYAVAANDAVAAGRPELVEALLAMAEVEWDHEAFFRERVEGHGALRWFPLWAPLAPREDLRRGERPGAGAGATRPRHEAVVTADPAR
jgi:demethoxyubiquinone hydroxylase (CLK1/Coq7/Cat5 family)